MRPKSAIGAAPFLQQNMSAITAQSSVYVQLDHTLEELQTQRVCLAPQLCSTPTGGM